jgi:hypothetical protein
VQKLSQQHVHLSRLAESPCSSSRPDSGQRWRHPPSGLSISMPWPRRRRCHRLLAVQLRMRILVASSASDFLRRDAVRLRVQRRGVRYVRIRVGYTTSPRVEPELRAPRSLHVGWGTFGAYKRGVSTRHAGRFSVFGSWKEGRRERRHTLTLSSVVQCRVLPALTTCRIARFFSRPRKLRAARCPRLAARGPLCYSEDPCDPSVRF